MHDGKPWIHGELCGHRVASPVGPPDIAHDVAVAHALVMSLPNGSFKESVLRAADEILKEWGYGDER